MAEEAPLTMTLEQIASGAEGSDHPGVGIDPVDLAQHRTDIFGSEPPRMSTEGRNGVNKQIPERSEAVVPYTPQSPTRRKTIPSGPIAVNNN